MRVGDGAGDIEAHNSPPRMPLPAGAEQPLSIWAGSQARVEEIARLPLRRCRQDSPRFRVF
jgi:hypothetical protein